MPTLNISGKKVQVGDEFLKMSPEQQNAAVEEIAGHIGVQAGPEVGQGEAALRGFGQGSTFGWGDEIGSILQMTPSEAWAALKGDPTAYRKYAEARDRIRKGNEAAQEQNPWTYGGAGLAGNVFTTLPAAGAMTGVGLASGLARGAASGAAMGAAQGAGDAETMQDVPGSAVAGGVGGGLVGGAVGGIGGAITKSFMNGARNAPIVLQNGPPVIAAGDRLGVPVPRAIASDSKTVQALGQAGRQSIFGGEKLENAAEGFKQAVGDAAEKTAKSIGTGDVLTAGEGARAGINDTIESVLPGKAKQLYNAVDGLVNPNVATDLSVTRQKVADIAAKRQAAALDGPGKAAGEVMDAITRPGGLTYDGIKTLRTNVGEMLKGGKLPADYSEGELKAIYSGLSEDLRNSVANAGGPDALKAFNRANSYRAAMQGRMEKLAKIVGAREDAAGEKVFSRLANMAGTGASADIKTLMLAKRSMAPDQWNEVTSAVINNLGRAKPGAEFSADRFMTQWGALSQNGKAALFGGNAKLKQALDDIATLSGRMKTAEKYANRSNTGRVGVAALFGAGAMVNPMSALTAALGGEVTARILSQPQTAISAAKWAHRVVQANRLGAKGSAHVTRSTIQFLNEIGLPQAANDLGKAITGPLKNAAGEDQQ